MSSHQANLLNQAATVDYCVKIDGKLLEAIPHDLYIPPEALAVYLDNFEGPLDLLLYLIRKHDFNILDIPMVELTRQYIAYIDAMHTDQFELAAEYLLMTALLIDIKSRSLLPQPAAIQDEEADPRAELVRRLLEYERIKLAAARLESLPVAGRDFMPAQVWIELRDKKILPVATLDELHLAWIGLLEKARVNRHHAIQYEAISVRACMSEILRRLQINNVIPFSELFDGIITVSKLIASFLALLELAREALITISQSESFGTIHVCSTQPDTTS
ncbi:MAG: segregation/condensation protein A [Nitrosomonas sp.]|nr:segregation/condensation protein A [Nitrosomonas sp.]